MITRISFGAAVDFDSGAKPVSIGNCAYEFDFEIMDLPFVR